MSCKSVMGDHGGSSSSALLLVYAAVAVGTITIAAAANSYWFQARPKSLPRVVGIIPARHKSPRFGGEPLVHILDIPMIQRTWEQAKQFTSLKAVVVATDDDRIADFYRVFGADVMTSENCLSERCNEALEKLAAEYDIVVNVHGDEPLIELSSIDGFVIALQRSSEAMFCTAKTALKPEDASDCNRMKDIVDKKGFALYFSRVLIPSNKKETLNPVFPYMRHLGMQVGALACACGNEIGPKYQCHDAEFLRAYASMPPSSLQLEEDLEPPLLSSLK